MMRSTAGRVTDRERARIALPGRAAAATLLAGALCLAGCGGEAEPPSPDVHATAREMAPQGRTRTVDFETDEGTWMSLDVSPDGRWIAFDLLGQVYRLPSEGGRAEVLTGNSGVALNFHPAWSPDGSRIAFVSDRSGQNGLWTMDADGSDPEPVFVDPDTRLTDPEWTQDGRAILAVRAFPTPGRGWHRQRSAVWRFPLDGGEAEELLGGFPAHYHAPSVSSDGRRLYVHVDYSTGRGLGLLTAGHRLQRLDLETGAVTNVRSDEPAELPPETLEALNRVGYAADLAGEPAVFAPEVSPDGRRLAFAAEVPGETFAWRGHELEPRTALRIRDLETGEERTLLDPAPKDLTRVNAQYAYRVFPGYAWAPDGNSLFVGHGGKIRRIDAATGEAETVPFTAPVRRTISEQARGRIEIDDEAFVSRFLQWPATAPGGDRLAFVGVGRVWIVDLPDGTPRPLLRGGPAADLFQHTPAWSPDGRWIAFTTWDDRERGHLWKAPAEGGGPPVRLTDEPGEYLYPAWAPDGRSIVVTRGPGPDAPGEWHGWDPVGDWVAVRVPADGSAAGGSGTGPDTLVRLGALRRTYFGAGGRLYFERQRDPSAASDLYLPYPREETLRATETVVRSVAPDGSDARDHLRFPGWMMEGNHPVLSPDGRRAAYLTGQDVFVAELPAAGAPVRVETNPNESIAGRTRVTDLGGAYLRWRDTTTLEFFSGPVHVAWDAATGEADTTEIVLRVPRPTPDGTLALEGAKIVTLEGDRVVERGDILVSGSRIACVGETGECDLSGADRRLDVSGTVVVPGFVDVHAHHTNVPAGIVPPHWPTGAQDLAYGVTTIVDPFTDSESAFPLAELVEAGRVVGPRTYSTAEGVITRAHAWGDRRNIGSYEDAFFHVRRRARWGAASIKNYRQTRRAQHRMLIAAAREVGISVTSEGGPLYFDVGLAMDGQTGWEHFLAPLPVYSDATRFFGMAGMVYSPTVIVAGHVNGAKEWFRPPQGLLEDGKYGRFMPRPELEARVGDAPAVPKSEVSFPMVAEGLADIVRAGGYGAIGEHGEQPGIGSHWEIWAYAEALSPLEALRVASLHGAYFIGLEEETGSIEAGKLADLVVLDSDPLEDIRATADIRWVLKAGRLYDGDTLDEAWPAERPYGPVPWQTGPPSR